MMRATVVMMRQIRTIRTSTLALAAVLGIAGAIATVAPAAAQPAGAIGKPLGSPDLPVGTVSVRVIAGGVAQPVVGTTVTLVVNDAPREARTDAAGRANFPGLPVGATVIAKIVDEDKAEKASDPFQVADAGGTRVMLTTKPIQAGAGGDAPFAGGAGGQGMPNPRQLSGEGRPEQADPSGQITVRVTYDDFRDTPEGVTVTLVGYAADDSVTYKAAVTDRAGRVQFTDLDRSGGTAYYAMAELPRGSGVDRLTSFPTVLESQRGVRMVLSGEKRSSPAPAVDDLSKGDRQVATPAGKVRVALEGVPDKNAVITLIDAATKKPIGQGRAETPPSDPTQVQGGAQFTADPKLPPGTVEIVIVGGPGQQQQPMGGVPVSIVPASSTDTTSGVNITTSPDGTAQLQVTAAGPQKAAFTINTKTFASQAFDVSRSGGRLTVSARWDEAGHLQSLIDAPTANGQVVYVECVNRGTHYRSLPFQLLEATGTKISVFVFPRTMFRFGLTVNVEDQLLAVRGRFEVSNWSWAPYRAGPDGLLVPMPQSFKGGIVIGNDQAEVSVSAGEGFRIIRPIPPGGRPFRAAYSLPIENGKVTWTSPLPMGSYQGEIDILQTPGMTVHAPDRVPNELHPSPQGTWAVLGPIAMLPGQPLTITIEGMPSPPAWRTWIPRIVGVLVILVIVAGFAFALAKKPVAVSVSNDARRQELLEQLVAIERDGGSPKRRDELLRDLEKLWG